MIVLERNFQLICQSHKVLPDLQRHIRQQLRAKTCQLCSPVWIQSDLDRSSQWKLSGPVNSVYKQGNNPVAPNTLFTPTSGRNEICGTIIVCLTDGLLTPETRYLKGRSFNQVLAVAAVDLRVYLRARCGCQFCAGVPAVPPPIRLSSIRGGCRSHQLFHSSNLFLMNAP